VIAPPELRKYSSEVLFGSDDLLLAGGIISIWLKRKKLNSIF
jgi:hypothetical protein